MKTDKGLLQQDGTAWALTARNKLQALNLSAYLSVNESQGAVYTSLLPEAQLVFDNPDLPVHGPLKGLLSAHIKFPKQAIVLLACDLPDLPERMAEQLLKQFNQYPFPPAICYSINQQPEPMCSIFHPDTLKEIYNRAILNKLEKFSMRFILDRFGSQVIELAISEQVFFKNYNSPADL